MEVIKHSFSKLERDIEQGLQGNNTYFDSINNLFVEQTDGKVGSVVSIPGNIAIAYSFPAGTNTIIGGVYDEPNDINYFLVHNSNGTSGIYKYTRGTGDGTVSAVLQSGITGPSLGWPNVYVDAIRIIEGRYLTWTFRVGEVWFVDLEQNYTGSAVSDLHLIPQMPLLPPTAEYVNDPNYRYNNVRYLQPQFRYRYIYKDGRKSRFSPMSKLVLPNYDFINVTGTVKGKTEVDNKIEVTVNTGSNQVKTIQLAMRPSNVSDFFIVEEVDNPPTNTTLVIDFYNDKVSIPIVASDIDTPFDSVWPDANTLEVQDNRTFLGASLEGFDNIESNNVAGIEYVNLIGPVAGFLNAGFLNITAGIFVPFGVTLVFEVSMFVPYQANKIYTFFINSFIVEYISPSGTLTTAELKTHFTNFIQNHPCFTAGTTITEPFTDTLRVTGPGTNSGIAVTPNTIAYTRFKRGKITPTLTDAAIHQLGIVYSDAKGRHSFVQTNDSMKQAVQPITLRPSNRLQAKFNLTINSTPPLEATHYHIVYSKNQTKGRRIYAVLRPGTLVALSGLVQRKLHVSWVVDDNGRHLYEYQYEEGDRMRYIKRLTGTLNDNTRPNYGVYFTSYIDVEVDRYNASTEDLFVSIGNNVNNAESVLVEIYNPKKQTDSQIWYETGYTFEIGNAGLSTRFHKASDPIFNQQPLELRSFVAEWEVDGVGGSFLNIGVLFNTITNDLLGQPITVSGTLYFNGARTIIDVIDNGGFLRLQVSNGGGLPPSALAPGAEAEFSIGFSGYLDLPNIYDTYVINRVYDIGSSNNTDKVLLYVEESRMSDFYESDSINIGRPNAIDKEAKQKKERDRIRFSNVFEWGTFEPLNFRDISLQTGQIRKLQNTTDIQDKGSVMLAITDTDCFSLYIGKAQFREVTGQATVALSDSVIGAVNLLSGGYGTMHPESVREYEGRVFWWCEPKGHVIRYTRAGLDAITGIGSGVRSVFDDKQNKYFNRASLIRGGIDPQHGHYLLFFPTISGATQETWAYNMDLGVWNGKMQYYPQHFAYSRDNLITFQPVSGGTIWLHKGGLTTLYGQALNRILTFNSNCGIPSREKLFSAISLESTTAVKGIDIFCGPQFTNLIQTDFETFDSMFFAEIPRDLLTPSGVLAGAPARYEGDPIEGRFAVFALAMTTQGIRFANVNYIAGKGVRT